MSKRRFVLSIDQGTTSSRASVLDAQLRVVGVGQKEFTQHFPKPGLVEHDLNEIWATTEWCIAKALRVAGIKGNDLAAIGITNQRETTGLWNRSTGKPLHNAIVWQDRRTADFCAELKARGEEARVREATGLVLDPYFSGTKLKWLLDNVKGARAKAETGELAFGTIDTWLVYKLTGHSAHVTDVMTKQVITVSPQAPVDEIAGLLEVNRTRRVFVVSGERAVGVVARADLVRALACARQSMPPPVSFRDDASIRREIVGALRAEAWPSIGAADVSVTNGVVTLWGGYLSEQERKASLVLAENIAGVRAVNDHRVPLDIAYAMV